MKTEKSQEILEEAKARFKIAEESYSKLRKEALDDLRFRAGEQWEQQVKYERQLEGRPTLTINRMPQFIRQIVNDARQNKPAIKVHAVDDAADKDTARILQGIIRHIEYSSNAQTAYITALEGAAIKGFGYFRLRTEYVSPISFEQEIKIERIRNHFSVLLDPNSKEIDGSDAEWGFIFEDMQLEDFKKKYPEAEASSIDLELLGSDSRDWINRETIRVAEYFYKEKTKKEIYLLSNGKTVFKEVFEELEEKGELDEDIEIIDKRITLVERVKWVKINGLEVLEETTWAGRWIPIIPVYGDELDINGEVILEGIIRHAKDPQRMMNYWASTEAESIALSPKAPYIVAEGQIPKEYEYMWKTANRKNHAYLPYKPTSHSGQPLPPPQRNAYEPAVQAITNARMLSAEDIKATTGIYDAAIGNRSNETSGIGIQVRASQSQTANYHLIDNLNKSIQFCGRQIVDLIPKIYDTERTVRIIGEDGTTDVVKVNAIFEENGREKIYDLGYGQYDVTIDTGASYQTKRKEALNSMAQMVRYFPQLMQYAGDLLVKNMDWNGAEEIANRLRKTLPPVLLDESEEQLPPQVAAQLNQMQLAIQQLQDELAKAKDTIDKKTLEIQSKERIEFAKMENDLLKEELKRMNIDPLVFKQMAELQQRQNMVGQNMPSDFTPEQMRAARLARERILLEQEAQRQAQAAQAPQAQGLDMPEEGHKIPTSGVEELGITPIDVENNQ